MFSESAINIPPVFIAQMVHLILRNILDDANGPMRLHAAGLFFRDLIVSIDLEQVMLADLEIVEIRGKTESVESTLALVYDQNQSIEIVLFFKLT